MIFNIITIFPEIFQFLNSYGVLGKAIEKNIIEINAINLRDFSNNKHNKVDDEIYGGGPGMLMTPEPIYNAIKSIENKDSKVLYLSPQGSILDNSIAKEISDFSEVTLLCGHYEGIDQRIIDNYVDYEVSIGDYIVTGGELPAMVLIDVVSRFIPGVVGNYDSIVEDSFYNGLLKYPCYTRPRSFNGFKVPDVLLSGNHQEIEKWREEKSLEITKNKRPDLLD